VKIAKTQFLAMSQLNKARKMLKVDVLRRVISANCSRRVIGVSTPRASLDFLFLLHHGKRKQNSHPKTSF
jgi:hypothetical protein